MQPLTTTSQKRIKSIDVLRSIAMVILVLHYTYSDDRAIGINMVILV